MTKLLSIILIITAILAGMAFVYWFLWSMRQTAEKINNEPHKKPKGLFK